MTVATLSLVRPEASCTADSPLLLPIYEAALAVHAHSLTQPAFSLSPNPF